MSVIHNDLLLSSDEGGYNIAKSLRFRSSASAYLNKSYSGGAGNTTTFTWSAWVKRGSIGSVTQHLFNGGSGVNTFIGFGQVNYDDLSGNLRGTGGTNYFFGTSAVFRDPAAWYHVVLAVDTTQATSSNRLKLYVNGVLQSLSTANYPPQNQVLLDTGTRFIGQSGSTYFLDGYLTDTYFIDGTQKSATDFGETDAITGVWKPKAYSGTYGTNGFYLKFTDVATTSGSNAGLGKDFSGNGNYWTTNNISVTSGSTYDSMKDVPTLTDTDTANYAVISPIVASANNTVSNGNLTYAGTAAGNRTVTLTGLFKQYGELTISSGSASAFGLATATADLTQNTGASTNGLYGIYDNAAGFYLFSNGTTITNIAGQTSAGVVFQLAYDSAGGKLWIGKNNVWYDSSLGTTGNPSAGTNPTLTGIPSNMFMFVGTGNFSTTYNVNFGQQPFAYTPPTGYVALNTYNLPDSTIVAGNKVMDATTYTGNNASRSITNAGAFKPDFIWIKDRSRASGHVLVDSVRGVSKAMSTHSTSAESTTSFISSFDSTGFSLPANTTADDWYTNINSDTFVSWQWQAGQGTTSSNTSGSITSTVSVNASAGFSIVTYTGTGANATFGHGLGVAPSMVIIRNRSITQNFIIGHKSIWDSNLNSFLLFTTSATSTNSAIWNGARPTSSVISIGSDSGTNGSGNSHVAYCWSEIAGFSKFGSYTGNGSTDGPFVYTGFRPKYVLFKSSSNVADWYVMDSSRNISNDNNGLMLDPNLSGAEQSGWPIDFLSNGFKLRYSGQPNSAQTYIYAAFAENPFKNSLAR